MIKRFVTTLALTALLGSASLAVAQPATVSAQGGGASGVAQFCEEVLVPSLFPTIGACVSAIATAENPGKAEGVGECKFLFAYFGIPQQYFGQCVRELQGGH